MVKHVINVRLKDQRMDEAQCILAQGRFINFYYIIDQMLLDQVQCSSVEYRLIIQFVETDFHNLSDNQSN